MRYVFLTTILTLGLASVGLAAWGPRGCAPSSEAVASHVQPLDGWKQHKGIYYWYVKGEQKAAYDPSTGVYRTFNASTASWGPETAPPWKKGPPTGVVWDKVKGGNSYSVCGQKVGKEEATALLTEASEVPNDAKKLRLTLIGSPEECKSVLDTLAKASATDNVVCQSYRPDDWALRPGFVTKGHPSIYLESPDGKVLLRQQGLDANTVAAVRKASPDYSPARDPMGLPSLDLASLQPYWPYLVGGGVLLLL